MTITNVIGLCGLSLIVGISVGTIISHEVSHYSGRMHEKERAKVDAMQWAKKELKAHCPAWFTDRRASDYMACKKPEWMK